MSQDKAASHAPRCEHTEHAMRSDGQYGRFFPEGTVGGVGKWEPCPVAASSALRVGTELITAERAHQVNDRGFDGQHDIDHRSHGILAVAAVTFIEAALGQRDPHAPFPLMDESLSCKPRGVADPIHDLVKAGALIAAEIDRLRAIGVRTAGNEGVWL